MPKVSIVISTYKRPDGLKNAINSVLNQTFQDFEIIVVHDGNWTEYPLSHPNIKDERITYLSVDHFGNDTKPKNTGILASKGEYIALLDDDNTFRPDHLQILLNELDKHPDIDIVYGDRWLTDETGQVPPQVGKYSDWTPGKLMIENYIDTSDVLIRREALFYVGGLDETQKKYIDWNLWVRLEKAGFKFKRVPQVITNYNIGKDSKSLTKLTNKEKEFTENNPGQFMNIPDFDTVDCDVKVPFLGGASEPRVAIFTLTYDRLEMTKKSFDSLHKTAGYKFDHYVVDNGSSDGSITWLKNEYETNPSIQVVLSDKNLGISKGSNKALDMIMEHGDYDIIVKVDNDAIFQSDGWLAKMVEIWKSNNNIALSCYVSGLKDNPGGATRYHRGIVKGELLGMTHHLGGICHFVDARAYKNFRWDENDYLHSAQDLMFSQYLEANGYAMGYLENYYLSHGEEGTEAQHKQYPEYFERRKTEKRTKYEESK